ncbi:MAG: hypothetical protein XD78_0246 [Desulfotomaculum sp. 46_296]|nr:MAG: hypothetical protein XD78_0246 [Desulfotomaculum sp. 46_296]HAU31815.1 hypothetical protein [Desulfotomaculum sp.]
MVLSINGMATGIGSLPFLDEYEAANFVLERLPKIPHWPQLPGKGEQEGFVFQYLYPLVKSGLLNIKDGQAYFDTAHPDWIDRLAVFYSLFLEAESGDPEALEQFSFPRSAAAGFYAFEELISKKGLPEAVYFKGQLTGPLTVGFQIKDEKGRPAYYDEQLRDLLVKSLAVHARWQAKKLAALGRPVIVFIDEPAIRVYGQVSYITISGEMIQNDLSAIVKSIHEAGAFAGVHSCDEVDWSLLFGIDLDIVNLDVYSYGDSLLHCADELKKFLDRGCVMAWGIVPTNENAFKVTDDSLFLLLKKLWQELAARGIDIEVIEKQSMITPACGTGLLSKELTERIYQLNGLISDKIRKEL